MAHRIQAVVVLAIIASAPVARASAHVEPTAAGQPAGAPVVLPSLEVVPPAEIKPESFVYVAATQPDRIGRVMAPVYVNGVGPFAFVVDTGASSTVIAPRVVRRLSLPVDHSNSKLLRGITGSEVVPTVLVDDITAGGIKLTNSSLPVVEPRVFADADGIFGADAFARGCLVVNFVRGRLAIHDKACPRVGEEWERARARLEFGGLVVVDARVGNIKTAAIIDTGAERSLGNPALLRALRERRKIAPEPTRTQVYAATSHAVFGDLVKTPQIRVAGVEIGSLQVVYGDFEVFRIWGVEDEPAIVLGIDVLGSTDAMMIDYRKSEVRFLPRGGASNVTMKRHGIPSRLPQRD